MTSPWQALGVIAVSAFGFGVAGALVGLLLGVATPGYYRSIFGGDGVVVEPVPLGIGLGVTQGLVVGIVVGAFLVVWFTLRPRR